MWVRGARRILLGGPDWESVEGDLLIDGDRIAAVGGDLSARAGDARVLDATGLTVLPGLVQTHVHLCQTLFRGLAEDLRLLPWLRTRVWPLEAAHDPDSLRASARLSAHELLRTGTTTILDMGTTHHHGVVFEVLEETGLRAASGKAMMDEGEGVPLGLLETTLDSLRESFDLAERWNGGAGGRLRYAFAPRFVLSCSDVLLREVVKLAKGKYLLHTHAAEAEDEADVVRAAKGRRNVEHLHDLGFLGPGTALAHCVWLSEEEIGMLASTGTRALHCPNTNLKLGSGIAELARLRSAGVHVSIGSDGAPANNLLDGFDELRSAARLAQRRSGPGSLTARDVLTLATRAGAEALGWEDEIGCLEPGRAADLIAVDLETSHAAPTADPVTALVYSARGTDVRHSIIAGTIRVEDGTVLGLDEKEVVSTARAQAERLVARADLGGKS
ncbi:MAG: amidohydrolase family protein [bacterium]